MLLRWGRKTGAGVRVIGDKPLARIYYWSVKTTLCPEAYINLSIQPKRQAEWGLTYRFYTLKGDR